MNTRKYVCGIAMLSVFAFQLSVGSLAANAETDKEKKRRVLLEKIEKLEREKAEKQKKLGDQISKMEQKTTEGRETSMSLFEGIIAGCKQEKSPRCVDAYYQLASLAFDDSREQFVNAQKMFEKTLARWEKNKIGPAPMAPVPNYKRPIELYEVVIKDYPDFPQRDNALYRVAGIYLQAGELDKSFNANKEIVDKYPNGQFAASARLRVGDHLYMRNKPDQAIEYFQQVNREVGIENYALAQFRIGSCYYAMNMYKEAIDKYFEYIDRCDTKEFPRADFRDEALEYMGASFAELPKPIDAANAFFVAKGKRPYIDFIIFTIGKKCRENDKNDEAIATMEYLLKTYPDYPKAPEAQQIIVTSQVVLRHFEEANLAREKVVDYYGPNGKWVQKHGTDSEWMKNARKEAETALSLIPIYFHDKAQREKKPEYLEKAAKRYKQYIEMFPENKWTVYEFSYYLADCSNELKRYKDAAYYYEQVAAAPVSTFGPRVDRHADDTTSARAKALVIKQDDAGYNAVVAMQMAWKTEKDQKKLSGKDAYRLSSAAEYLKYSEQFMKLFPTSEAAPEITFLAANFAYDAEDYAKAIASYKEIIRNYPQYKDVPKVQRMLAQCYVFTKQHQDAIEIFKALLTTMKPEDPEFPKIQNAIASAMYKMGEELRNAKKFDEAARQFLRIPAEYPKTTIADIALFDAAALYEKQQKFHEAAETFIQVAKNYTTSKLGKPSLVRAAEAFMKAPDYNLAARAYEQIYVIYPKEKDLDKVLYNAGLTYEKGKNYNDAIRVYLLIDEKFPQSEYASDALFSVALAYEQKKDIPQMVATYKAYIKKYSNDKNKLIQAYAKLAEAYYNDKNDQEAEPILRSIVATYKKYEKTSDMDPDVVAKSMFFLGEIRFRQFDAIKLVGSKKDIEKSMKEKQQMLKEVINEYAGAIKLGLEEWTLRSTYRIAGCFVGLAEAVRNQTVSGSKEQQIAARIAIIQSMPQFYQQAETYFGKNIDLGISQGINSVWVNKSEDEFLRMRYRQAYLFEEAANILLTAPMPAGMSKEDKEIYKEEVEEKAFAFKEKALPIYESGIKAAAELYISKSPWLDSLRAGAESINPTSAALAIVIKQRPTAPVAATGVKKTGGKGEAPAVVYKDARLKQAMKRIDAIMARKITTADKISQLRRIARDAQTEIEREQMRIKELKDDIARKKNG